VIEVCNKAIAIGTSICTKISREEAAGSTQFEVKLPEFNVNEARVRVGDTELVSSFFSTPCSVH